MKSITTLLSSLLLAGGILSAQTTWTLQEKTYNVDTLYHAVIGPGTTRTSLQLSGAQNLRVHYTTTDLTNPNVEMRVTKGSNKLKGCTTLSAQCKNATVAGAKYFAGVNADFFGNSQPIGTTVVDSEVYYALSNNWVSWFITKDKKPGIATIDFSGTVTAPDGSAHRLSSVNNGRYENNLVVYTPRFGSNTSTNIYGYEVALQPLDGGLRFAGEARCKVISAPASAGSMVIPSDGYVLSGNGTAATFVQKLAVGDEISVVMNPVPGFEGKEITQVAGGQPAILSGGKTLETQNALDHLVALNPRTAVGYNADGTRLVLLVVDGRSTTSVGVVSKVLADIMREVGCTEAMNFDGGGSSELYSPDFGVINRPSDGQERAVTNAVWAVAVAPEDNQVAELRFEDSHVRLPRYAYFHPVVYAYNKYGVLISNNFTGYTLSCPEELGSIRDGGATLYSDGSGTHALTATYNGISASVPVSISPSEPYFRLTDIILDNFREYCVEVQSMVGLNPVAIDNKALVWESLAPEIATVDDSGVVRGVSDGVAVIRGSVGDFSATLNVTVQCPASRHIPLVSGFRADDWTASKTSLKSCNLEPVGEHGFAFNYVVSSTRGTNMGAKTNIPLYSLPDSIRLVVNPCQANISKILVNMAAAGQASVGVTLTPDFKADAPEVILVPISDFINVEDLGNYPVSFTSVVIYISDKASTEGRIEIPAVDAVYTSLPTDSGVEDVMVDPSPDSPAEYFNLQGQRVNNHSLLPGIYIVRRGTKAEKIIVK